MCPQQINWFPDAGRQQQRRAASPHPKLVKLSKEQGKTANRSARFFVPGRPFSLQETVSEGSYDKAYSNLASRTKNNVSIGRRTNHPHIYMSVPKGK